MSWTENRIVLCKGKIPYDEFGNNLPSSGDPYRKVTSSTCLKK